MRLYSHGTVLCGSMPFCVELDNRWEAAGVPSSILSRQLIQENDFMARHQELMKRLTAAQETGQPAQLQALKDYVDAEVARPTHLPTNLNKLPWHAERASVQEPMDIGADTDTETPETPKAAAKAATVPSCEVSIGYCGCSPGEVLRDWKSPNPQSTQIAKPDEQP